MKELALIIALFSLLSCKVKQNSQPEPVPIRDSLISQWVRTMDSLPWTDTFDVRYKLLKAYYKNDTSYLRKSIESVGALLPYRNEMQATLSCQQPQSLESYGFREAYRFQYSAAFCDQSVNLTIGNRNDSVYLLCYHYYYDYRTDSCLSVNRTE